MGDANFGFDVVCSIDDVIALRHFFDPKSKIQIYDLFFFLKDTKGPEIRTGILKDHQAIDLEAGQELEITTDYTYEGDSQRISCSYPVSPK